MFVRNELAQWVGTTAEPVLEDSEGRAVVLKVGTTAIVAVHYATQVQVPSTVRFNAQLRQLLLTGLSSCTNGTVLMGDCNVNLTRLDSEIDLPSSGPHHSFFETVVLGPPPEGVALVDVFRRDNPIRRSYSYQVRCLHSVSLEHDPR